MRGCHRMTRVGKALVSITPRGLQAPESRDTNSARPPPTGAQTAPNSSLSAIQPRHSCEYLRRGSCRDEHLSLKRDHAESRQPARPPQGAPARPHHGGGPIRQYAGRQHLATNLGARERHRCGGGRGRRGSGKVSRVGPGETASDRDAVTETAGTCLLGIGGRPIWNGRVLAAGTISDFGHRPFQHGLNHGWSQNGAHRLTQ